MRNLRDIDIHLPKTVSTLEWSVPIGILTYSRIEWTMKVDPISSWVIAIGELHSAHFAYNDSTCVYQQLYCRGSGIPSWIEIMESSVSATCSQSLQIKYVFDTKPQLFRVNQSSSLCSLEVTDLLLKVAFQLWVYSTAGMVQQHSLSWLPGVCLLDILHHYPIRRSFTSVAAGRDL